MRAASLVPQAVFRTDQAVSPMCAVLLARMLIRNLARSVRADFLARLAHHPAQGVRMNIRPLRQALRKRPTAMYRVHPGNMRLTRLYVWPALQTQTQPLKDRSTVPPEK